MRKNIICVAEKFILGGVETYYMRMFKWAYNNGFDLVLLLPEGAIIVDEWKLPLENLGVNIWFYSSNVFNVKVYDNMKCKIDLSKLMHTENTIVCDNLHTYVTSQFLVSRMGWLKSDILFYVLHPEMSRCSERKILNIGYRQLLVNKIIDNGMIFMDEQTMDSFEQYYNYKDDKKKKLLRLGQEIPDLQQTTLTKTNEFNILSICRMDFPFKGYVLGLVDTYVRLKEKYPGIKLTLIGDGPQRHELLDKIERLAYEQKRDIIWIRSVPYVDIPTYISECNVYVGMGTTLLDAGKLGKIGIIATANQYNALSCGYLFENPDKVAVFNGEKGYDKYTFDDLIERVIQSDDNTYTDWSMKSYKTVKDNYDIDSVMDKMLRIKTNRLDKRRIYAIKVYDSFILWLKKIAGMR